MDAGGEGGGGEGNAELHVGRKGRHTGEICSCRTMIAAHRQLAWKNSFAQYPFFHMVFGQHSDCDGRRHLWGHHTRAGKPLRNRHLHCLQQHLHHPSHCQNQNARPHRCSCAKLVLWILYPVVNQRFQLGCYSHRQIKALKAVIGSLISDAVRVLSGTAMSY
jgi:hypothetical protein